MKKDWAAIACLVLAAATPFVLELFVPQFSDNTFVRSLVFGLPGPVAPVLVGLVAGWLLDKLRSPLDPDIDCPSCHASITPPAHYCPLCGTALAAITSASAAARAELARSPGAGTRF